MISFKKYITKFKDLVDPKTPSSPNFQLLLKFSGNQCYRYENVIYMEGVDIVNNLLSCKDKDNKWIETRPICKLLKTTEELDKFYEYVYKLTVASKDTNAKEMIFGKDKILKVQKIKSGDFINYIKLEILK